MRVPLANSKWKEHPSAHDKTNVDKCVFDFQQKKSDFTVDFQSDTCFALSKQYKFRSSIQNGTFFLELGRGLTIPYPYA